MKLLDDLASKEEKGFTEEESDCLRGLIADKLDKFKNHLTSFEVLAYYLWEGRFEQHRFFESVNYSTLETIFETIYLLASK